MSERAKATAKTSESKTENSVSQTKKNNLSESASSPIDQILFLQRTVGNHAVERLLKSGVIQAKLTIGQPGDIYEQEADRVAEQVMRMPDPSTAGREGVFEDNKFPSIQRICTDCNEELQGQTRDSELGPLELGYSSEGEPHKQTHGIRIQRKCSECKEELRRQPMEEEEELLQTKKVSGNTPEVSSTTESQINNIRGSGQPLPESVRAFFEPRFGHDFSGVCVHTDSQAAGSAQGVNALAYTVGKDVVFGAGRYAPETKSGRKLIAHELTHVVQQSGKKGQSLVQRQPNRPGSREATIRVRWIDDDVEFYHRVINAIAASRGFRGVRKASLWQPFHDPIFRFFRQFGLRHASLRPGTLIELRVSAWFDPTVFHGQVTNASVETEQEARLGETTITGVLTPRDNFAGRSTTRFGVGEVIDFSFFSLPPRPATDFGGLEWHLAAGGGTLAGVTNVGTATFTAPATAGAVQLELRVASGATAGRVISSHAIMVVIPSALRLVAVAGSFPNFGGWGSPTIPAGTWGVGFRADEFIDPKDVSFQGVVFGEGTVAGVVTPAGSFLSGRSGLVHPANTHGPGLGGNTTTGTRVTQDGVAHVGGVTPGSIAGVPICGASDFLWAIPWEFSVAGGPRARFAGGFVANQHLTSTLLCGATVEKAGAGPFCRRIDGTTC